MKNRKRILAALGAALLLPALGGCTGGSIYANYREVKDLQLIQTLGVDADEDGDVTLSIASGVGLSGDPSSILSAKSASLTEAMDKLRDYASRETLFFAHTRYMVLGEDTARQGVDNYLDYVARMPQMRTDVSLFVVKGGEAKTLVTQAGDGSYDITDELGFLEQDVERRGTGRITSTVEVARALAETGAALVYVIEMADSEGVIYSGGGGLSSLPGGYGVLKNGALCGYIPNDISRGVNLVNGHVGGGSLPVIGPDGGVVTLFLIGGKTELEPVWEEDGRIRTLRVKAKLTAAVEELENPALSQDPAFFDYVSAQLSVLARGWLTGILDFSRELDADFLALGQKLRRNDPVKFSQMPQAWEQTLPELEFEVSVTSTIRHGYENTRPLDITGKGIGGMA